MVGVFVDITRKEHENKFEKRRTYLNCKQWRNRRRCFTKNVLLCCVLTHFLSIENNHFTAVNQALRSYQSKYFAYWVDIISSAKRMKCKIELNKTNKH